MASDALAEAHKAYTARNSASLQAYTSSCNHLPGGNTRTVLHASPFPMTFASGSGCTLTSLDGDTYTDFLGEYTAGIYGHNHPIIRRAINEALDHGWSLGGNNVHEKKLARIVCERFSPTMELVRFTNSGTEANMMAVATALAWTGRKKILVFDKAYHGATLSFRAQPPGHADITREDVNIPHDWVLGTYNDIRRTESVLSAIPPASLAAIIVEPMLGSGGAIPGSSDFLHFLRSYATSCGALLIFDEVMTSRLSFKGLCHRLGIRPDLMTLGKWVGGGMSFGAFGGRRDIMAMFNPRNGSLAHAGTFNNNVISMAAGCAGCGVMDVQTTDRLNDLGEQMKTMIQEEIHKHLNLEGWSGPNVGASDIGGLDCILASGDVNCDGISNGVGSHISHLEKPRMSNIDYPQHNKQLMMWVSGIGSILTIHFAPSPAESVLQSLYWHFMLAENVYLAERGFIALNIQLTLEDVTSFVAATGRFLEKYRSVILGHCLHEQKTIESDGT